MTQVAKRFVLYVAPGGIVRHIHDPELTAFTAQLGQQDIRRASHVDPTSSLRPVALAWLATNRPELLLAPNAWWADLLPVNGPVLGPFPGNTEALAAEIAWLHEHTVPTPNAPPAS